jgi:hypothetical protein
MEKIKIHGLMRSGTNFLEFLITKNFGIQPLVNEFAWKHGGIREDLEADTVIIYKNIYSWLVSIYNYALRTNFFKINKNITFSEFVHREFIFNENRMNIREENSIAFYNKSYKSWFDTKTKGKKIFISYELLLDKTEEQMNKLAVALNKKIIHDNLIYPEKNILPDNCKKIKGVGDFKYSKKKYYKNKEYMQMYSKIDLNFVNKNLDQEFIKEIEKITL